MTNHDANVESCSRCGRATWNPAALPPDYQNYLRQWWQWHQVRLVAMFTAMCLVFAAMLVRK
jgi:uncharacterized membrane protein